MKFNIKQIAEQRRVLMQLNKIKDKALKCEMYRTVHALQHSLDVAGYEVADNMNFIPKNKIRSKKKK